jgi:hypothetical protein
LSLSFLFLGSSSVAAYNDGMEGSVVKKVIKSIETGNVNYVLIWLQKVKSLFGYSILIYTTVYLVNHHLNEIIYYMSDLVIINIFRIQLMQIQH